MAAAARSRPISADLCAFGAFQQTQHIFAELHPAVGIVILDHVNKHSCKAREPARMRLLMVPRKMARRRAI